MKTCNALFVMEILIDESTIPNDLQQVQITYNEGKMIKKDFVVFHKNQYTFTSIAKKDFSISLLDSNFVSWYPILLN